MPQVNGNNYRSFGQGYRAEKMKSAADEGLNSKGRDNENETQEGNGPMAHVKHEGGGKYKIKLVNHDGSSEMKSAESHEQRRQILDEHFGANEDSDSSEDGMHDSEMYADGEGDGHALKSILGSY